MILCKVNFCKLISNSINAWKNKDEPSLLEIHYSLFFIKKANLKYYFSFLEKPDIGQVVLPVFNHCWIHFKHKWSLQIEQPTGS